jgi:hypothetical protein
MPLQLMIANHVNYLGKTNMKEQNRMSHNNKFNSGSKNEGFNDEPQDSPIDY